LVLHVRITAIIIVCFRHSLKLSRPCSNIRTSTMKPQIQKQIQVIQQYTLVHH